MNTAVQTACARKLSDLNVGLPRSFLAQTVCPQCLILGYNYNTNIHTIKHYTRPFYIIYIHHKTTMNITVETNKTTWEFMILSWVKQYAVENTSSPHPAQNQHQEPCLKWLGEFPTYKRPDSWASVSISARWEVHRTCGGNQCPNSTPPFTDKCVSRCIVGAYDERRLHSIGRFQAIKTDILLLFSFKISRPTFRRCRMSIYLYSFIFVDINLSRAFAIIVLFPKNIAIRKCVQMA